MSTREFNLDSFLDDIPVGAENTSGFVDEQSGSIVQTPFREPGYEGSIDYRIRQLSYSSITTLATCPRKFQLYKLRTTHREAEREKQTVTFAFGHVVGEAIQLALEGRSEQDIVLHTFLGWHADLFAQDERGKKSFWEAVIALKRFRSICAAGFLQDYELVYYEGKPACELSFAIHFPDGFRYRGFVDAVLRHRHSGKVIVLECKTTGAASVNPSQFKNSGQAIGYSIVLDSLFPALSSYEVLYLVYQTKGQEFTPIPFQKTYLQRALWIRELLLDIEMIKMYEEASVYPMRGNACVNYSSKADDGKNTWQGDCEYINSCTLSTGFLTKPATEEDLDRTDYQITLSLADLLTTQMEKLKEITV